jgi:hypothetical protein
MQEFFDRSFDNEQFAGLCNRLTCLLFGAFARYGSGRAGQQTRRPSLVAVEICDRATT